MTEGASNPSSLALRIYQDDPEEMLKPWKTNSAFLPIVSTHAATFVVGTVGNGLVVVAMGSKGKSRSATSVFLVSLALADLLLLLFCVPLETLQYFVNAWDSEGSLCKLASYVEVVSAASSVLNLIAITLERYIVIVYPMRSRSFCTMSNCRKAILIVWVIALLLAAPVIFTKETYSIEYYNNHTNVTLYYCNDVDNNGSRIGFIVAVYHLVILLVVPFFLMVFCYSRVIKELWISTKNMVAMTRVCCSSSAYPSLCEPGMEMETKKFRNSVDSERHVLRRPRNKSLELNSSSSSSHDVKQARKQVIQMLILVIILFLLCWGPRLIIDVFIKHGLSFFSPLIYNLRITFHLLPFIHSCLNPIIYSIMSSNLRSMMARSFAKWPCVSLLISICCKDVLGTDAIRRKLDRGATSSFIDGRRFKTSSTKSTMVTDAMSQATIHSHQVHGVCCGEIGNGSCPMPVVVEDPTSIPE